MRANHDLAQGLGQELGVGALLFGCLPLEEVGGSAVTRRHILVVVLLALVAFAVASLVLGADFLGQRLPGGLPLGNLLAALVFCGTAGAALALSRPGTALRVASIVALAAAVLWLPVSATLAGNLELNFSGTRGSAWLVLSLVVAVGAGGMLLWAFAASLAATAAGRARLKAATQIFSWIVVLSVFAAVLALTVGAAQARGGYSPLFLGHIAGGTVFLGLGALQFIAVIRDRFRRFHRANGRVMLVAALVSIGSLYAMLPDSQCRACLPSQVTVTTVWLLSIVAAWLAIRRGDVAAHRLHMARGYVSASYFLLVRLMDHVVGVERLLPFVENKDAQLAISDWLVWVVPVLVVEVALRAIPVREIRPHPAG